MCLDSYINTNINTNINISLSLYIYIYIYICMRIHKYTTNANDKPESRKGGVHEDPEDTECVVVGFHEDLRSPWFANLMMPALLISPMT